MPGADDYTLKNNPCRHPPGHLKMRRQEFLPIGTERPTIKPIGTCPTAPSSKLFQTSKTQGCDNKGKPIRIIYRIKEHPSLVKEAQKMDKNQAAQ